MSITRSETPVCIYHAHARYECQSRPGASGLQGHYNHHEHLQPCAALRSQGSRSQNRRLGLRGQMSTGSSKACNCSFWASGRRTVAQTGKSTCPCQPMEGELVDITRLQVPPRAPKRQLKGCLFFCQSILAKTAKIPVFPTKTEAQGSFASFSTD